MIPRRASFGARVAVATGVLLALSISGCAIKKTSDPPTVALDVGFPSTAAAAETENVTITVYAGEVDCLDALNNIDTSQPVTGTTVYSSPAITPCDLMQGHGNTVDLDLNQTYTMIAVGNIAGKATFVGCTTQHTFGDTVALSVPLTFIDNKRALEPTNCTSLSDKCNGTCK